MHRQLKTIFLIAGMLGCGFCFGQGNFNTWYFGENAGLDFNGGTATPLANGAMFGGEGVASVSDNHGNLLFYTNGITVWNKQHAVMLNGNALAGNPSTTQGTLIIPMPGDTTKYYLFTLTDLTSSGTLSYSLIDMTLDNGKGGILPNVKNMFVADDETEKMAAATATNCGVWLISHKRRNDIYEARLVTPNGIGGAVISHAGGVHVANAGHLKVSRDNRKLAAAILDNGEVDVLDFDPATGIVSNGIKINSSTAWCYSACFSPDGSKLYAAEDNGGGNFSIYQYELSDLLNSKMLVGASSTAFATLGITDLQIAPDDRLYVSRSGKAFLGVVPNPNLKAPFCNFIDNAISFPLNKHVSLCLPNDVRTQSNIFHFSLGPDTAVCQANSFTLQAPPVPGPFRWFNGATTPAVTVTKTGTYWLTVTEGLCEYADTIRVSFNDAGVDLGTDKSICSGSSILLQLPVFSSYLWSDGSTGNSISISQPGTYSVEVTNGCGLKSRDTMVLTVYTEPATQLKKDTAVCEGKPVQLDPGPGLASYTWNTGSNGRQVKVDQPGLYWVTVLDSSGCRGQDSIRVAWKDCGRKLFVPSAFTPNGDGLNDALHIAYQGYLQKFSFRIYNRWGQVIFSSTKPSFSWDGKFHGKPQDTGVFIWMCSYQFYGEPERVEKGTVTLVR